MTWTNPPAVITQLRTQLAACAAWTGGTSVVHYPELAGLMASTFPLAVLAERSRSFTPYADGAQAVAGGELEVAIYATDDIGTTEALARTIVDQLLAQASGIPFRASDVGLSSDPSPGKVAGASAVRSITIRLPWGLSV